MSQPVLIMILLFILAALYLPVVASILRKHEGQETAAALLGAYAVIALFMGVGEALLRGGQWQVGLQFASDIQLYGALLLAVIMLIAALEFTRREIWTWLVIGVFWGLVIAAVIANVFNLGDVVWTNGTETLTRDRLAPALSAFGWFIFTVGALVIVRSSYARSRQPLLRNRLNYWTPAFLLIFINDIFLIVGRQIPGNPLRLIAAFMVAYIIGTHNPPDLRLIARRVLTYIITTIVIVGFYVAGFSASQTVFEALPNFNPLLVGAGIALVLSFIFTPLLSLIRRMVNKWF
ncbi:MAG TPA: hypothetical protein VIS72_08855, partial [Anaerolineales bacterium]